MSKENIWMSNDTNGWGQKKLPSMDFKLPPSWEGPFHTKISTAKDELHVDYSDVSLKINRIISLEWSLKNTERKIYELNQSKEEITSEILHLKQKLLPSLDKLKTSLTQDLNQ